MDSPEKDGSDAVPNKIDKIDEMRSKWAGWLEAPSTTLGKESDNGLSFTTKIDSYMTKQKQEVGTKFKNLVDDKYYFPDQYKLVADPQPAASTTSTTKPFTPSSETKADDPIDPDEVTTNEFLKQARERIQNNRSIDEIMKKYELQPTQAQLPSIPIQPIAQERVLSAVPSNTMMGLTPQFSQNPLMNEDIRTIVASAVREAFSDFKDNTPKTLADDVIHNIINTIEIKVEAVGTSITGLLNQILALQEESMKTMQCAMMGRGRNINRGLEREPERDDQITEKISITSLPNVVDTFLALDSFLANRKVYNTIKESLQLDGVTISDTFNIFVGLAPVECPLARELLYDIVNTIENGFDKQNCTCDMTAKLKKNELMSTLSPDELCGEEKPQQKEREKTSICVSLADEFKIIQVLLSDLASYISAGEYSIQEGILTLIKYFIHSEYTNYVVVYTLVFNLVFILRNIEPNGLDGAVSFIGTSDPKNMIDEIIKNSSFAYISPIPSYFEDSIQAINSNPDVQALDILLTLDINPLSIQTWSQIWQHVSGSPSLRLETVFKMTQSLEKKTSSCFSLVQIVFANTWHSKTGTVFDDLSLSIIENVIEAAFTALMLVRTNSVSFTKCYSAGAILVGCFEAAMACIKAKRNNNKTEEDTILNFYPGSDENLALGAAYFAYMACCQLLIEDENEAVKGNDTLFSVSNFMLLLKAIVHGILFAQDGDARILFNIPVYLPDEESTKYVCDLLVYLYNFSVASVVEPDNKRRALHKIFTLPIVYSFMERILATKEGDKKAFAERKSEINPDIARATLILGNNSRSQENPESGALGETVSAGQKQVKTIPAPYPFNLAFLVEYFETTDILNIFSSSLASFKFDGTRKKSPIPKSFRTLYAQALQVDKLVADYLGATHLLRDTALFLMSELEKATSLLPFNCLTYHLILEELAKKDLKCILESTDVPEPVSLGMDAPSARTSLLDSCKVGFYNIDTLIAALFNSIYSLRMTPCTCMDSDRVAAGASEVLMKIIELMSQ